ncbi:hypothetical protein ONE63_003371 [Megalurothrips usitatus]|uniref:Uncharacterized protein n=1 Tax=Megalurothrips usitatus TaxID=439358 RepID=A0AAV7XAL9_9NEOP|nr:hypothetical protein ONE63_003371 [Megalurothrips usitatus]KAJ1521733.1 hypothetical protein ONE63_003371 [Megalurothrips usitatus]KAJ1521734.1 hypothetical protein ONE63_003371 [Megalurothrips usitatus]
MAAWGGPTAPRPGKLSVRQIRPKEGPWTATIEEKPQFLSIRHKSSKNSAKLVLEAEFRSTVDVRPVLRVQLKDLWGKNRNSDLVIKDAGRNPVDQSYHFSLDPQEGVSKRTFTCSVELQPIPEQRRKTKNENQNVFKMYFDISFDEGVTWLLELVSGEMRNSANPNTSKPVIEKMTPEEGRAGTLLAIQRKSHPITPGTSIWFKHCKGNRFLGKYERDGRTAYVRVPDFGPTSGGVTVSLECNGMESSPISFYYIGDGKRKSDQLTSWQNGSGLTQYEGNEVTHAGGTLDHQTFSTPEFLMVVHCLIRATRIVL